MKVPGHLQLEEIRLPAGQEWQAEGGQWSFLRLSIGEVYWLAPARPRAFSTGGVLILAPTVQGIVRASQISEVVLHVFGFVPEMLYGFFTLIERRLLDKGLAEVSTEAQLLPSTHPLALRFAARISSNPSTDLVERAGLLSLAAEYFATRMGERPNPAGPEVLAQQRFHRLVAQMPDLEMINHTPEELAELCGCGVRHFNRLFHHCFGQSPRARLTELRLIRAAQLLACSDEKIAQVAQFSNYRSLSLFNALFKRRFGMSPSEWRHHAAGQPQSAFPFPAQPGPVSNSFRTSN